MRNHTTRPTICHVLHSLDVGGGEVLAKEFALANEDQYRPVFALLDTLGQLGSELQNCGYEVFVADRKPGFDWSCAVKLNRFFKRQNVSIIHSHQYAPLFYAALGRARTRRPPIVFTEHGRAYPDYRRSKRVLANRILLTRRDRYVAVGHKVRQALIDNEGLAGSRVEVVYNGRDLERYKPDPTLRASTRRELGIDDGSFVIIQVARLDRLKDHPTAVRAMSMLLRSCPHAKLLLVGEGPERSAVESLIGQLGLQHSVRTFGSRNDVPRLLQAADAFLLSSISEGIPLTLIEAMASGLPCVATDVGGIPEIIDSPSTGLTAPVSNSVLLARHLERLANSVELRSRIGQAGRQHALNRFGQKQMHDRYRQIYDEIAKKPRRIRGS